MLGREATWGYILLAAGLSGGIGVGLFCDIGAGFTNWMNQGTGLVK